MKCLEIGNQGKRQGPEWTTLDIVDHGNTDIVADITQPLSLTSNFFDKVYMSHVLEHVVWTKTVEVLKETRRILKTGGELEVHVPDGEHIIKSFIAGNTGGDDWWHENPSKDLNLWLNGRIFAYGDSVNLHKAIFTMDHLLECLFQAGFTQATPLTEGQPFKDHGAINMGVLAIK